MKEMTTAEFAKANLAVLTEPVRVRRYTKMIGTYYPNGSEPAAPPVLFDEEDDKARDLVRVPAKTVSDLEEEVRRLKRELAARSGPTAVVPRPARSEDPFSGLAKQDREFFERKLGGKKK